MDKSASSFEYQVTAVLGENRITHLQTPAVDVALESATPPEFPNGIPNVWSPETYFLTAISGCYLNTFQALSDKFGFMPAGLRCEARGTVAFVDGKFGFTAIEVIPEITLADASQEAAAVKIAEKAHKYCLISNSVKCPVTLREPVTCVVPAEVV
jgi:organic hydroperoxide reductase OsmC/OhrA